MHFLNSRELLKEKMMADGKSSFVYVTYIRTSPEELWAALTTSELMKKYWFGMNFETDWKAGSPWKLTFPHTIERADSKLIEAVSGGWPRIVSNLKSLLETGQIILS